MSDPVECKPQLSPKTQSKWEALLRHEPAVFFWLRGKWHMRTDRLGITCMLTQSAASALEAMKSQRQMREAPVGYYRCVESPQRPISNDLESPLARLFLLKDADGKNYIDATQLAAGERIRQDFERACLSPRVTTAYQQSVGSGGRHWQMSDNHIEKLSDGAIAARQNFNRALEAVGPELSGMVFHVCCLAGGLEQAEQRLALPRRSGKVVLSLALKILARHYGITPPKHRQAATSHWAMTDFKPQIAPQHERLI